MLSARDAGARGDRGDRGRPEPVALEQVARRQHHGQAPGAGLLAAAGRVVGPLDFGHRPLQTSDTVRLYLIGVDHDRQLPVRRVGRSDLGRGPQHPRHGRRRPRRLRPAVPPAAPSTARTAIQPPSSRVPGPAGFYSTALWLRAAFADLHYDIHHAIADGNLVAVNSTMNGRHIAPWAVYTDDGRRSTPCSHRRTRPSR